MNEIELLSYIKNEAKRPLTYEELAEHLSLSENAEREKLGENLAYLEDKGLVVLTRRKRYALPQRMDLLLGRLQGHSRGYAFLLPDEKYEEDVFIPAEAMNGAWHNDRVIVRLEAKNERGRNREGKVIRIVEQSRDKVVGTLERKGSFGFVIPDDARIAHDIFIEGTHLDGAETGMKVAVEIISRGDKRRSPSGKIIDKLGMKGDKGVDILSLMHSYSLPEKFPPTVLKAARRVGQEVKKDELKGRLDLRESLTITIDDADARDLDDAINIERLPNGNLQLGVHIADVAHYVKPGTLIDQEAYARGTSIYLVDRVLPMLPPELSNGICSLNVGEDRLTLSCIMEIDANGQVVKHELAESVIRVGERMTYVDCNAILEEGSAKLKRKYRKIVPMLEEMSTLADALREKRNARGAVDFNFPESKVELDSDGHALRIYRRERGRFEGVIEEFMVAANEVVAEHFYWLDIPFIYRIHEPPSPTAIQDLNTFLGVFGQRIKSSSGTISPNAFQSILHAVAGKPEERLVSTVMLRSMKHAAYDTAPVGHFGLASQHYSHFTAPIRRYPDLAIHRVIKKTLKKKGALREKEKEKQRELLHDYAERSSLRERIAEEAERESLLLKKVEYMQQFVGDEFSGIISSVTGFGFFVELENLIEGLVHVSDLDDDFYHFNPENLVLTGEHTRKRFAIGQKVEVLVAAVSLEEKRISFVLAPEKKVERKNNNTGKKKSTKNATKKNGKNDKKNDKKNDEKNKGKNSRQNKQNDKKR